MSAGLGWIGSTELLYACLRDNNADRDEQGKYLVMGGIFSFMGGDDEVCVDSEACFRVGGQWRKLAEVLQEKKGEGVRVCVIA